MKALCVAALAAAGLVAQEPVGSVAGEPVPFSAYLTFLGLTRRDTPLGRELLRELRDRELVAEAAKRLGLTVTAAELEAAYRQLARRVERATQGRAGLTSMLRRRGLSQARFREALQRLVLLKKVIRRERGLPPDARIGDADARRWLENQARRAGVVTDPAELPPGMVLRIGRRTLPAAALGALLHESLGHEERRRAVDQLLRCRLVALLLAKHGLAVTAADLDKALQRYPPPARARLRADPRFRARLGLEKLGRRLFTRRHVEAYYASHQDRFGPTVRVRYILIRVQRTPPLGLGRPRAEAQRLAHALRSQLLKGESFARLARRYSDHPSRLRGGDIGWIHRRGDLEPTLADAAFALEVGEISPVLETEAGFHLLAVTGRRPAPPFERVAAESRAACVADWFARAFQRAECRNRFAARSP